jgi:hypothetical protein
MPQPVVAHDNSDEFARTRYLLRDAWNTRGTNVQKRAITPFRSVNNAGDEWTRMNYSCGGGSQAPQSRPNVPGIKSRSGAVHLTPCDQGPLPAACNVKYVYDGSDYTRYLHQRAVNRTYNDRSFGGASTGLDALRV